MKRAIFIAMAIGLTLTSAQMSLGGEENSFESLNGGNILQSLNHAARKREVRASFDVAKIEILNDVAVITGAATDHINFIVTLHKDSAKVRTVVLFVKQWEKKDAAEAVFSIMAITKFMGRLVRPDITDETLGKMYVSLVGKEFEAVDGKVRKARLDGVLLTSGFEKGAGFAISAVLDDKK